MSFGVGTFGEAPFGTFGGGTRYENEASATADVAAAVEDARNLIALVDALADVADTPVGVIIPSLVERMAAVAGADASNAALEALSDVATFADPVLTALAILLAESAGLASPAAETYKQVPAVEETLLALGLVETRLDASIAVVEALLLADLTRSGWSAEALAGATVGESILPSLTAIVQQIEAVTLGDAVVPGMRLVMLASEEAVATADVASSARLFEALAEGVGFFATVQLGDAEYSCYVLNAATGAVVEYQNFPFNSFAEFDGHYYGASSTGLYRLGGNDDAGDPIDAWVRTAISNVGTGLKKRLPTMYLGYTSSGTMVLKVVTTLDTGSKVEDWYEMVPRTAVAPRENRVKVGRGLHSVYWAFELHNVAGADFALDTIQLYPVVTERRV